MSSDFAKRLSQPSSSPYANRCSVGHVLTQVTDEERAALEKAINNVKESLEKQTSLQTGYTARWLSRVLGEFNFSVSDRMIRRHCAGDCSCES